MTHGYQLKFELCACYVAESQRLTAQQLTGLSSCWLSACSSSSNSGEMDADLVGPPIPPLATSLATSAPDPLALATAILRPPGSVRGVVQFLGAASFAGDCGWGVSSRSCAPTSTCTCGVSFSSSAAPCAGKG